MRNEEWTAVKKQLVDNDRKAFEVIYNHLWSRLYAFAYNIVRDKGTAQEIVQEVFVRLWIKRQKLQEVDDIVAYTMRSVRFQIYDYFDKRAVIERYVSTASQIKMTLTNPVEKQIEHDETYLLISREIEKLPETTKRIFRLSRFDQFTNEEIASKLHVSVKTVEYHITQSLKHLRIRLASILKICSVFMAVTWLTVPLQLSSPGCRAAELESVKHHESQGQASLWDRGF
jgi:RNA polymerase sigma-70 factor (ECF subfamily)